MERLRDLVLKSGWYSHTIVIGGWLHVDSCGCECFAEKKYACVNGEKFERTLAHDFEADFFSVVCTRVHNEPFRFHFIVVEQYWRLMSGHNKPDMVMP